MTEAGQIVGERFRIERMVARGGMGAVYRARDLHADGLAAVKIVGQTDADSLERFVREARLLAELHHPGIVRYLGHGRTDAGELYLAMEWLEGEDLGACITSRALDQTAALRVVAQATAALAVAHARRIIHRDVKPSNLFLVDFDTEKVKLLDFGIARLAQQEGPTATGVIVGTPQYMAPEQARGSRAIDARADVFALGAVLHRLLSGRLRFTGRTAAEVLGQLLHEDPPRLRELRPDVPAALDDLVARSLSRDPDARPRDAGALLAELMGLDPASSSSGPTLMGSEVTEAERRSECLILFAGEPDAALAQVVTAHGGKIEPAAGGTLISLSGQRVATDQARTAARCALALARERPGTAMALAIGRRRKLEDLERLLGRARHDVRVDATLAGLLDARFVVAGDDGGLVLHRELPVDDEARTLLGKPSPFVGRDQELGTLTSIFDACAREGEARAVLVTAPPGMGKSRLRQEFARRLPVEVWVGRGDPMRAGAPFSLLGEAVRRAAGITGDEPLEERRRLLLARVGRHVEPARAAAIAEFIGEMAGVPFPGDSLALAAARRDARLLGDQLRAAIEEWLRAECGQNPVVIVLEDLHWGDAPTVKVIDSTLQALQEQPLMVLALARPEVKEQFPELWAARGIQTLSLGQLSRRAAERLVRQLLGEPSPEVVARLVERAGGNAFYLEELVRHVAGGGEGTLPETVLAMVETRLAALPAEARRVLRAGSVFGEVFWRGAVRALLGGSEPDVWLDELCEREVIRRRERARFPGEDEYAFRHGLIRDAAYAMLTDSDRTVGHRLAGGWLEAAGEADALALAEHFQRGEEPARAVAAYRRAAEQALAGNDMAGALARAALGVSGGAAGEELGRLLLLQAEAHAWNADHDAAQRHSLAALASLPPRSAEWFAALGEAVAAAGRMLRTEVVFQLIDELRPEEEPATAAHAIAYARAAIQGSAFLRPADSRRLIAPLRAARVRFAGEPRVLAWVEQALSWFVVFGLSIDEALELRAAAAEHYRQVGDLRNACLERLMLGSTMLHFAGDLVGAEPILREAITTAEGLRIEGPDRIARGMLAHLQIKEGNAAGAADIAELAARMAGVVGYSSMASYVLVIHGMVLRHQGALETAAERARKAIACSRVELPSVLNTLSGLTVSQAARLLVDAGHAAEAEAILRPMFPRDSDYMFAAMAYAAHAHALRALGDTAAANVALATGWRIVQEQSMGIADPASRARFLEQGLGGRELRDEVRRWLGE